MIVDQVYLIGMMLVSGDIWEFGVYSFGISVDSN